MAPTPVLLSWSGGKDSMMSLLALRADPDVEVVGLLTSVTAGYERVSVHGVRRALLDAQAEALGLPVTEIVLQPTSSNAAYEAAFAKAVALPMAHGVRTVAFGDLFLEDVRTYREALLARLGLRGVYPVWGRDTATFAKDVLAEGVRAVLCAVDTTRLDAAFVGRDYDEALLADLPDGVDAAGRTASSTRSCRTAPASPRRWCSGAATPSTATRWSTWTCCRGRTRACSCSSATGSAAAGRFSLR